MMDRTQDELTQPDAEDNPPAQSEAAIGAMLEQSRSDIIAGRIVPLAPILERMRTTATRMRAARAADGEGDRLPK